MKSLYYLLFLGVLLAAYSCEKTDYSDEPRVLVFSKTKGWNHTSIPNGIAAIQKLGAENGFLVDTTKNADAFTDKNLRKYHAVIFLSTTGNVLNPEQQAAFERYIQAGGGYVGIHAAADTEYEWAWYDKLVGAHFASHPHNPNVRKALVHVTDKNHPSTSMLPDEWEREDEWYNFRSFYADLNILAYLDEDTYEGGTHGSNHAIAWYHEFDGGRAFYTGGGHTEESFSEPFFLEHLLGGIKYAMGTGKLDYGKAKAIVMPEENRFVKTVLVNDLSSPMELTVADDGRIFYTDLSGANLAMYNTKTGESKLVHRFDVTTRGGTGLIGVTLDPNFSKNNYIYLYYSPLMEGEPILFNLSRFTLKEDNTLDLASEKVLLQVPVQENSGAHHGGSLCFDSEGNLYLSTGDSTTPFPSDGYAPLDERLEPEYYSQDAQRSSANTNDFKGKILRIHPEPDGTYTIPKGNLFKPGTENTLPEIYVMGCRNPYRISVNEKTGTLYWGEIGPDAGEDSPDGRGPKGYDEFNQAKGPGNFGWPYFIGNNQAYAEWDFATSTAGPKYDPKAPVNNSPNNTGLKNLPPAQPAMIWYPYASSAEFPELGVGGRSALVGDFYWFDKNSDSETKFPEYYDGMLFVFEWMRNWVMAIRFDENENFKSIEPFMTANGDFRRPIDAEFGKDGVLYMLEYGSVYGADNDDARLVKIEYNRGNRAPIAKAGVADSLAEAELDKKVFLTSERRGVPIKKEIAGQVPLRVNFTSRGSNDPDSDDKLTFEWMLEGNSVTSTERNPTHTYTKAGIYNAILKISDQHGAVSMDTVLVKAGNEPPKVRLVTSGNTSFFWEGQTFPYTVQVEDAEDGAINPAAVKVYFDYNAKPGSLSQNPNVALGELVAKGAELIDQSDCKACHTLDKPSVGPTYTQVSERYKGQKDALAMLTQKIIKGGGGNWGESLMSAHPQLAEDDVKEMVSYILSITEAKKERTTIATQGKVTFNQHKPNEPQGVYTFLATYTDKGANGIEPITSTEVVRLRPATVRTAFVDAHVGIERYGNSLGDASDASYLLLKNIDLTGIKAFVYNYSAKKDGFIEVRRDSRGGPVIAKTNFMPTEGNASLEAVLSETVSGKHDVYFIIRRNEKPNDKIINIRSITFAQRLGQVQ